MKNLFSLAIVSLFFSVSVFARDASVEKIREFDPTQRVNLLKQLGVSPQYDGVTASSDIGVAIIDDDFGSLSRDADAYPERFEIVNSYSKEFLAEHDLILNQSFYPPLENYENPDAANAASTKGESSFYKTLPHGLWVLHSMLGVLGRHTRVMFYFLNGNRGFNFAAAALYAEKLFLEGKIRTVVNSQNLPLAGLGNGTGPLDRIVGRVATTPGLVWINATGNDGGRVWAGTAKLLKQSQYVQFRANGADSDCLRFKNKGSGNTVTVNLIWDGRQARLQDGVQIDYDLEITDPRGRRVGLFQDGTFQGALRQRTSKELKLNFEEDVDFEIPEDSTIQSSETIELTQVPETLAGSYCIRVRAVSKTKEIDELQVLIQTDPASSGSAQSTSGVEFIDANSVNEVFQPASAPGVISVGTLADYSSRAENSSGRMLPIALMETNKVYLNNKFWEEGTSFSAPYLAAVKLLMESQFPAFDRSHLMSCLRAEPGPVSLEYLKKHLKNGMTLIDKLVAYTGYSEDRLRGYLYPDGVAVVTLPEHPGRLLSQFPRGELNRQEAYEYFFGLRASVNPVTQVVEPISFSYYRALGSRTPNPWEITRLPFAPYDLTEGPRPFRATDFIRLEKEVGRYQDFDPYTLPELQIRRGQPRDQVRRALFKAPSKEQLRRLMQAN